MDVLIVEPMDPEALDWLAQRHEVLFAPELAEDSLRLRMMVASSRAVILPPSVPLDAFTIQSSPELRAVGRLSAGAENIDIEACLRAGIEVVRPQDASATAEAEFVVGALLQLLRRVPVVNAEGLLVGRELGEGTVGLIGLTPTARPLARLLRSFGTRVLGYDPAVHAQDGQWTREGVEALPLRELFAQSDAVCVLLTYFTRYHGLLGERYLEHCKANQVLVSIAPSSLFEPTSLAYALASGRLAGAWFDSLEPGLLDRHGALHGVSTVQVTPRLAGTTVESRVRAAWNVARRVDAVLRSPPAVASPAQSHHRRAAPADDADLSDGQLDEFDELDEVELNLAASDFADLTDEPRSG
jgi:D-3-phosphoglycerate dehydrogenase / 2-oxoglutarate reductase